MAPKPGTRRPSAAETAASSNQIEMNKYAFDVDGRAKARREAPITIGGQTFHAVKQDWDVTRGLRKLLRAQERAVLHFDKLTKELDALDVDAPDEERDALEDRIDDQGDARDLVAFQIISLLLNDEKGENPQVEFLRNEMDRTDAGDLVSHLLAGPDAGVDADPTQTTPSS